MLAHPSGLMGRPACLLRPSFYAFPRLALCGRAAEPVGVCAGGDDVRTVRQPVDQRLAQPRVRDHLRPFGEWQVGGDDHRRLLGPVGDHLEHQLARRLGQRHVAQLVDADQVEPFPSAQRSAELVRMRRLGQLVDQPGGRREPNPAALPAGRHAQARRQVRLARAGVADQQDPATSGKRQEDHDLLK